jgi:hypothetical protein
MISGAAEGMAVCDPCVRIRETVFGDVFEEVQ